MKKKTIVISASMSDESKARVESVFDGVGDVRYLEDRGEDGRAVTLKDADILISFSFNREIDREEYRLLGNLELLQTISTGVDYLPFSEIPSNITIACNAGGWAYQIAEHSVAMIMALYRRFVPQHNKLAGGVFDRNGYELRNLRGSTFCAVGYGGIGRHTAAMLRPFGVKIMALNTSGRTDDEVDFVGTLGDIDSVLEKTDIVLLSIPLTRDTEGLIGKERLGMMKPDACLINVARAPLVDERALYEHLKANPDFLAGLDVWWEEPTWSDSRFHINYPFFDLPNFLGSPHNSNYVRNSFADAAVAASENVRTFLEGKRPGGLIRREDYVK